MIHLCGFWLLLLSAAQAEKEFIGMSENDKFFNSPDRLLKSKSIRRVELNLGSLGASALTGMFDGITVDWGARLRESSWKSGDVYETLFMKSLFDANEMFPFKLLAVQFGTFPFAYVTAGAKMFGA